MSYKVIITSLSLWPWFFGAQFRAYDQPQSNPNFLENLPNCLKNFNIQTKCVLVMFLYIFLNNDIQFTKLVFICCLYRNKYEFLKHTSCIHACIIKQYKKEILSQIYWSLIFPSFIGPGPSPKILRNKTYMV